MTNQKKEKAVSDNFSQAIVTFSIGTLKERKVLFNFIKKYPGRIINTDLVQVLK